MTTPNTPAPNAAAVPKDNDTNVAAAPPAYTPRRGTNIATMIARSMPGFQIENFFPPTGVEDITLESADDNDPEVDEAAKSPISLRINSSINVNRNNNIVCIDATPSENANAIAQAVAKAILDGSSGRCGIPMIDENGVPRPLLIEVDAGMVIEGANNIVGSREAVTEVLKHRDTTLPLRRAREEEEDDDDENQNDQVQPVKRRRSNQ